MYSVAGGEILAGSLDGQRVQHELLKACSGERDNPELVLLDFSKVELATASFLREGVVEFRDIIRRRRSNHYPVVANANDAVLEELEELLRMRGGAIMTCRSAPDGSIASVEVLGSLDPKQQMTFELVQAQGETAANELMRAHGASEQTRYATAWNNRLANLAALGLVMEVSQGRTKKYRALFKESDDGR